MSSDKHIVVENLIKWVEKQKLFGQIEPWRKESCDEMYNFLLNLSQSDPKSPHIDGVDHNLTSLIHFAEDSLAIPAFVTEQDFSSDPNLTILTYLTTLWHILGDNFSGLPDVDLKEQKDENIELSLDDNSVICPRCSKCPSLLERLIVDGVTWHRICFLCCTCDQQLRRGTYRHLKRTKYECIHHEHQNMLDEIVGKKEEVDILYSKLEKIAVEKASTDLTEKMEGLTSKETPEPADLEQVALVDKEVENSKVLEIVEAGESKIEMAEIEKPKTEENEAKIAQVENIESDESKLDENEVEKPKVDIEAENLECLQNQEPMHEKKSDLATNDNEVTNESLNQKVNTGSKSNSDAPAILVQESPSEINADIPVPPPRRKRRSGQSSRASSVEPSIHDSEIIITPISKPKPPVPPKPKVDIFEQYPDYLNPFGSEEEDSESGSDYDESLNPFAIDDEDDTSSVSTKDAFSDTESVRSAVQMRNKLDRPVPAPRLSLQPQSLTVNQEENKRRSLTHSPHPRPKRPAPPPPPPPTIEQQKPHKPPVPPKPTKEALQKHRRKKRPAPPPPLATKRKVMMDVFGQVSSVEEVKEHLKKVDMEQNDIESHAISVQKDLSDLIKNEPEVWDKRLKVGEWIECVMEKCDIVRRESDLVHMWLELYLDNFHSDIEYQLRCILDKPESDKTEEDSRKEAKLLEMLLNVIEQKNRLVEAQQPSALVSVDELSEAQARNKDKTKHKAKRRKLKLKIKKLKKKMAEGSDDKKESK